MAMGKIGTVELIRKQAYAQWKEDKMIHLWSAYPVSGNIRDVVSTFGQGGILNEFSKRWINHQIFFR